MQGSVAAPRRAPRHLPAWAGSGPAVAIDGYTRRFAALLVFAGSLSEGSGAGLVPSGSVLAAMSASPERGLLGDHDAMEVLNSRVVLRPTDPERSRAFYRDTLGLVIYREFGDGPERGTVFFLGGGFLELSGRAAEPPTPGVALWLQVRDLAAARQEPRRTRRWDSGGAEAGAVGIVGDVDRRPGRAAHLHRAGAGGASASPPCLTGAALCAAGAA